MARALQGGHRNPVFLARRGNDDFVVRVSGRSAAALQWELDLIRSLADAGLTVPLPIQTDDGASHSGGVLVTRFIRGGPPRDDDDWCRVVEVLREVHDLTLGWPQRPDFASARELMTERRGGDVDLEAMPADAVRLVRRAWEPVLGTTASAIHGDVGAGNVLIDDDNVALIDWDEARVDVALFDYAHLPRPIPVPGGAERAVVIAAGVAWEAATCWEVEPDYARQRPDELTSLLP